MKKILIPAIIFIFNITAYSQNSSLTEKLKLNDNHKFYFYSLKSDRLNNYLIYPEARTGNNGFTFRLGLLILISVLNPIIVLENKKVYIGTTRELTAGFGKYTKFRVSLEYSFFFRDFLKHHFRASAKYDIQLHKSRGEYFDDQSVLSLGAGYFIDEEGSGFFPEITAGFKIGEGLLFFPYIKLRHTFMFKKSKHDNSDFSVGAILGIKAF